MCVVSSALHFYLYSVVFAAVVIVQTFDVHRLPFTSNVGLQKSLPML